VEPAAQLLDAVTALLGSLLLGGILALFRLFDRQRKLESDIEHMRETICTSISQLRDAAKDELSAIKPMTAVFYPEYVKRLHGTHLKTGKTKAEMKCRGPGE